MTLDIIFKNYTSSKAPGEKFFRKIIEKSSNVLKLKGDLGMSINLVGEKKIQELNKKYRHKNKPTDVLSFPIRLAPLAQGRPDGAKANGPEDIRLSPSTVSSGSNCSVEVLIEGQSQDFGDIFICLSIAKKEAKRENVSIERKLAQLSVHGFLHLKGCDHEKSEADAKEMFKLEKQILDKLK